MVMVIVVCLDVDCGKEKQLFCEDYDAQCGLSSDL